MTNKWPLFMRGAKGLQELHPGSTLGRARYSGKDGWVFGEKEAPLKLSNGPGRIRGGAVETSAQAVNLHKAFRQQGTGFKAEAAS